jgi:plasmid stability protein
VYTLIIVNANYGWLSMADVRVRNVEDWVVAELRARAKRHGKSLEGELREALREEVLRPKREAAAELRALREEMQGKYGLMSDSTVGIREDRDRRG